MRRDHHPSEFSEHFVLTSNRKESKLHGLINNAGIMGIPYQETVDGYEIQWQVWHPTPPA